MKRPTVAAVVIALSLAGGAAGNGLTGAPVSASPGASTLAPLPRQPKGVAFPTVRWPRGALPHGVTRSGLHAAFSQAQVRSLLAVKGGKLVYEAYGAPDGPETSMMSASIAKSFTSAVIGLLVGDGKLHLGGPAPVTAWADPHDPRHAITIADLLHMSSGLQWAEEYSGSFGDISKMIGAPNASEYAASLPLESPPGTVWHYSTGTAAILAGIIIDTLGGETAAERYIRRRVLVPIGITSTRFARDQSGRWYGGFGADSTPRDFARFGLLYLRDGVWNHKRILPRGWVDFTRTPGPASPQYGALWWLNYGEPGTFTAVGLFGQYILVAPAFDLVIVVTSSPSGQASSLLHSVYSAFANA